MATVASFANGDGLCFINDEERAEGFRVNRVEGNRLYPLRMPEHLRPGTALYREDNDQAFGEYSIKENCEPQDTSTSELRLSIQNPVLFSRC